MISLLQDRQRRKQFENIDHLQRWLLHQGINTLRWGQATALTVQHLWAELLRGESIMLEQPPLRVVHVAQVIVKQDDLVLIEAEQEFKRGGRRQRQRPPAEKMKPGESVFTASLRCLEEELGILARDVTLLPETYLHHEQEGLGSSYPGLPTRWLFHRVEAQVNGLPAIPFSTQESVLNRADPVERHFWEWHPVTSLDWH